MASSLWKQVLRQNFTQLDNLIQFLELTPENIEQLDSQPSFILNLPKRLAEKIVKNDLNDPIFKQFVPLKKERATHNDFLLDPLKEEQFRKSSKLLQKYEGRALIITTSACAMHCRYCFRKDFPYEKEIIDFTKELDTLRQTASITEVLLSGGDPLSLNDQTLSQLFSELNAITHLERIRIHTRFPIGIPERIDDHFLEILKNCTKQIWFIVHTNHASEFDAEVWQSLKKIQQLGIPVLSQSVLLHGVNDSVEALQELFQELINHGVMPYYLHQLDRATGTKHFEVSIKTGLHLIEELQKRLPGYAIPKYVQEIPEKASKTNLHSLNSFDT